MKNIKNTTRLTVLMIAVFSTFLAPILEAHAGILDWFTSSKNTVNGYTLNMNYLNSTDVSVITALDPINQVNGISMIQDTALVQTSSPSKTIIITPKYREYVVQATGYSSTVDQTDGDPFTTAWGTHVRDGIIATNFLPFGTKIKIPDVYGDKIFVVEDRMNSRYTTRIDIWFYDRQSALNFGLRTVRIQVVES